MVKPEESSGGNDGGGGTDTNTSPSPPLQSSSTTNASEPSSIIITASTPTLSHSVCENCSTRIEELEDMNRKLSTRNAELDLQLTNQGEYINELLGKNNELEQALAVTSMKSAEELMHTSTDYQQFEAHNGSCLS